MFGERYIEVGEPLNVLNGSRTEVFGRDLRLTSAAAHCRSDVKSEAPRVINKSDVKERPPKKKKKWLSIRVINRHIFRRRALLYIIGTQEGMKLRVQIREVIQCRV